MSSPEEEEEVPDLQLSFVFGSSAVKPQTPHILPEDAEPKEELTEYYSSETLCLSRTKLKHVAESILKNSTLKVSWDLTVHLSTTDHPVTVHTLQWVSSKSSVMHPPEHVHLSIIHYSALTFNSNCLIDLSSAFVS